MKTRTKTRTAQRNDARPDWARAFEREARERIEALCIDHDALLLKLMRQPDADCAELFLIDPAKGYVSSNIAWVSRAAARLAAIAGMRPPIEADEGEVQP